MKKKQLAFRVDNELHARIAYFVAYRGLSFQDFMISAVEQALQAGASEPAADVPLGYGVEQHSNAWSLPAEKYGR